MLEKLSRVNVNLEGFSEGPDVFVFYTTRVSQTESLCGMTHEFPGGYSVDRPRMRHFVHDDGIVSNAVLPPPPFRTVSRGEDNDCKPWVGVAREASSFNGMSITGPGLLYWVAVATYAMGHISRFT